jgi:DNA modification methylase
MDKGGKVEDMEVNQIIHGDCLQVLRTFPSNTVDSVVTDPPYGLSREPDIREVLEKWLAGEDYTHRGSGFMGKTWDSFVPGPSIWREVYRVLKPGGHALVFAGTRTQDLMTVSLRMAGIDNPFLRGKTKRINSHPTVKPTDLMAWLVRLITPPGGIVLDPFVGSGSTCVAARREGFFFIGIEQELEYVEIARKRVGEIDTVPEEQLTIF